MTIASKNLGNFGEDEAERTLLHAGYEILERNHRNKIGEIDIIAEDCGVFCFVEVKTKTGHGYGSPEEMVDRRKQRKLIKTAELYLLENELTDIDWRIDVVAVDLEDGEVRVLKSAVEGN